MLLDLFSEPDIFGIKWDALTQYNGALYPALPDLYGPTMNVRALSYQPQCQSFACHGSCGLVLWRLDGPSSCSCLCPCNIMHACLHCRQ